MTPAGVTPPQTVGPFFHDCLLRHDVRRLVGEDDARAVRIEGTVLDGTGEPVDDALVEIWQANEHGRYRHPSDSRDVPLDEAFIGYGRAGTGDDGSYWFWTIKPGAVPAPGGGLQAPHLVVQVFARGLLDALTTRLYFEDDPANGADAVLATVPPERRPTLVAQRVDRDGDTIYRFDIVLRGARETVFFDVAGRRASAR